MIYKETQDDIQSPQVAAVFFDYDWTISKIEDAAKFKIFNKTLASIDEKPIDKEQFKTYLDSMPGDPSVRGALKLHLEKIGQYTPELYNQVRKKYREIVALHVTPIEEVVSLIRDLHNQGVKVAITSNKEPANVIKELQGIATTKKGYEDIIKLFTYGGKVAIFGYGEGVCKKPETDMLEQAMQFFGLGDQPGLKVQVVGDRLETDVLSAKRLNEKLEHAECEAVYYDSRGVGTTTLDAAMEELGDYEYEYVTPSKAIAFEDGIVKAVDIKQVNADEDAVKVKEQTHGKLV